MASEVASAYVTLTANTGGLTTGLTAAEAKVRGFASSADRTASRASKSFSAMGVAMKRGLMVGGIAAGVALGSAVKTAADFETEMSALRSVTKAGAKDMDRLKESALDLGAATKFSALEVAGAQTELARAGMSTSQILGGSLKGSLALAAAGQMELADASATIVDTMGQFGLKVGDATHIADALAEAANATTADVGEMAQGLENVGNIARNAGLSFDQTVVGLELLAENGTKGAEAGSALRSMLTNIATPSAKAAKKMRELGLEFYDTQGNFKDFGDVSGMLQRSFAGLTAEQKQNAAAVIAGTYGQKALLAIMSGGPKMAREFEAGLREQGAAAEMAATMNDNLQGKLEQLGGAMETIKIRVGSALIPLLSDAAVATADWLDEIGDSQALDDFGAGLADGLRAVTDAAVSAWAAVRPLIVDLGSGLVDAAVGVGAAMQDAAPMVLLLGQALVTTAGAVIGIISPVLSLTGALMGLPGAGQAAAVALASLGGAMVAVKLSAATGGAVAFIQLAGTIRSATDAAALGAATFPRLAGVLATLASPAGLAGLAIGGVAAGIALLASGAFSGRDSAQVLADALSNVATQAQAADGAISGFRSAIDRMKDADVALISAKANLIAATENERRVLADSNSTAGQRAQAAASVAAAERRLAKARQESAQSVRNVGSAAVKGTVDLARLSVEITRGRQVTDGQANAMKKLGKTFGLSESAVQKSVQAQRDLAQQGASTADRVKALQMQFLQAASSMDTSTAAGQRTKDILTTIGNLSPEGLNRFAGRVQELQRDGVSAAQALNQALAEAAQERVVEIEADDNASPKIRKVKGQLPIPMPPPTLIAVNDQATGPLGSIAGRIAGLPSEKVINIRVQGQWPTGSPRVYEIPELMKDPGFKNRTFTVTAKPQGTGELESMARTARSVGSGDLGGLKGKYGGGSTSPLQSAVGNAGSLLIKANLDIANLPEVIAEANTAGLSIGGAFGESIDKQRAALARTVGQSNELIKRIEALRNLTGQLGRAQAAVKQAKGDSGEMKKARAQLAKVQADIAVAQKKFAALAGNDTAAQALGKFNKKIARQVAALNVPARDLRAKAEEFTTAKERFVEAFKTQALEQFDQDTQRRLDSIRGTFEDGFRQIGSSFELVPGIMSQVEARLTASTKSVTDAMQAETDAISETYRVRGKALDRELSAEMKAFDKQAKAREQAIDDQTKALTASEAKLAAIRGQANDANLNRGLIDAEEALREAITKRMPESEVKSRMRAVEDARTAVQVDALEKRAEVERTEADARGEAQKEALAAQIEQERYALEDAQELRTMALQAQQRAETEAAQARAEAQTNALQNAAAAERLYHQQQQDAQTAALESQRNVERASLERSLDNWGSNFMRLRAMVGGNHATVLGQINQFGDALSVSGERLGHGYADGIRKAFPDVRKAGEQMAGILARYLQLHSPADAGPLAKLDRWWKPLGATLLGGTDFDAAQKLMAQFADPTMGGASWGGVGGGPIQITVTVQDRTTVGMSRDQARRLASDLKPELDRIVSIR